MVIGLLIVGRIWFAGVQSIATCLGLLTAGLAIALQDVVKSVAGWFFLRWRKPFAAHSDIDFAYPTQRFYDNISEGKENARAKIQMQNSWRQTLHFFF